MIFPGELNTNIPVSGLSDDALAIEVGAYMRDIDVLLSSDDGVVAVSDEQHDWFESYKIASRLLGLSRAENTAEIQASLTNRPFTETEVRRRKAALREFAGRVVSGLIEDFELPYAFDDYTEVAETYRSAYYAESLGWVNDARNIHG